MTKSTKFMTCSTIFHGQARSASAFIAVRDSARDAMTHGWFEEYPRRPTSENA